MQETIRFVKIVQPIQDKCLGLICGNHEAAVEQHYNENIHRQLCNKLGKPDLTDAAFVRLNFRMFRNSQIVIVFICHGQGGGRTPGAEPNKLYRMAADKDADILLRGHTHSFCLLPPIPVLSIPHRGQLPDELDAKYKRAGNWGAWLKSYAVGPSTYDSRACYPARSLSTLEIIIEPHKHTSVKRKEKRLLKISMRELVI